MVSRNGPLLVLAATTDGDPSTFAGISRHLSSLADHIDRMARRSRRFSWYSWGFLFLTYGGFAIATVLGALFPQVTTTVSGNGVSTTTTFPEWAIPVGMIPALFLLALAIRELIVGRREAQSSWPTRSGHVVRGPEPQPPNWTETVQQCQQKISHAKSEVEWSFLPLVFGSLGIGELIISYLSQVSGIVLPFVYVVLAPLLALAPTLALALPLYFGSRRWVPELQKELNRQVGEVTRLEAEFLWRFGGASAPG